MNVRYRFMPSALLCAAALLQLPCAAMPVEEIHPGFSHPPVFEKFEFLEDPSHTATLDQIRAMPDKKFSNLHGRNFMRGFSSSAFWLRTSLHNAGQEPVEWVLQHRMATTDFAEFWVIVDGKVAAHAIGGDRTLMSEREIQFRYPSIKFVSPPNKTVEVYARIWNINTADVHLRFVLDTGQDFFREIGRDQLRLGVLYGIPLALAFYALIGWFVSLDRRFALYGLYTLTIVGVWAGINGQLAEFMPVDTPWLANDLLHIFALLSVIFSFKFAQTFLHLRRLLPKVNVLFHIVIWVAAGGIMLRIMGVFTLVTMLAVLLSAFTMLTPIAAWLVYRQGVRYARWYFFAQLLYVATTTFGIVGTRLGWFSYYSLIYAEIAFLGELLFLAVAQHDRVRLLQHEQRATEERYQDELQKRIELLNLQIEERTKSLEQTRRRALLLDEARTITKLVATGHFDARMTGSDDIEMNELACSVNSMAESLSKLDNDRRLWIAEISHELRTPLSVLRGEIELLRDGFRKLDRSAIESLHEEAIHLSRLVNDLHDLAVSYTCNFPCHFTQWDFCSLAREIGQRYGKLAGEKGIALKLSIPESGIHVSWDKGRIQQLLENLLANSIHYTDAPGNIELHVDSDATHARLLIEDSAPGVPSEEIGQLFEPFFRSRAGRSSRKEGSGLGLAICAAIVKAHGGNMIAEEASTGGLAIRVDMALVARHPGDVHVMSPRCDRRDDIAWQEMPS